MESTKASPITQKIDIDPCTDCKEGSEYHYAESDNPHILERLTFKQMESFEEISEKFLKLLHASNKDGRLLVLLRCPVCQNILPPVKTSSTKNVFGYYHTIFDVPKCDRCGGNEIQWKQAKEIETLQDQVYELSRNHE